MLDAFKQLIESGVMTEDTKVVIESAFTKKLQEQKEQIGAELREEYARKYNHDKTVMVEAIDRMLDTRLTAEMTELAEDKKALNEAKVAYHKKMKTDGKLLESFVVSQLGKELVEFQNDRQKVAGNFAKLEEFVVHALAKEIAEFSQDKKDIAETKVRFVREGKAQLSAMKSQFVKRSAKIVENTVNKMLTSEIKQLKEDINNARNTDFGRRLFEAFAQEYNASFLNEKAETKKLLSIIERKDRALSEAKSALVEKQQIVESKDREIRVVTDSARRKTVMTELLAPLGAEKRDLMRDLLEGVQTPKLASAFDKYLPAVMEGPRKKETKVILSESTAVTGDREAKPSAPPSGTDNILDIRKLAGLR